VQFLAVAGHEWRMDAYAALRTAALPVRSPGLSTALKLAAPLVVCLVVAVGPVGPVVAQSGFESALPANTLFFAGCANLDELRSGAARSRLGELVADPACTELRSWMQTSLAQVDEVVRQAVGVAPLELASGLRGRIALAACGDPHFDKEKDRVEGVALAVLADVGAERSAAVEFMDRLVTGLVPHLGAARHDTVAGDDVVTVPGDAPGYVRVRLELHGDTLVVVVDLLPMPNDVLAALIEGLDHPPENGFAASPRFRDSAAAGPGGGLRAWLDLGRAWQLIDASNFLFMGSMTRRINAVVQCRNPGALALRSGFEPEGLRTRLSCDVSVSGPLGDLIRAVHRPITTRLLGSLPRNASELGLTAFDPEELFRSAIASLKAVEFVDAAQVTTATASIETVLGAPMDELLAALDGEAATVSGPPGQAGTLPFAFGQGRQLAVVLGLKDAPLVEHLVDALAASDSPLIGFQHVRVDGQPCFRVTRWGITLTGAVRHDRLVVSTSEPLLGQLLLLSSSARGASVADDPRLQARVEALSPGWTSVSAANAAEALRAMQAGLTSGFGGLATMGGAGDFGWLLTLLNPPALDIDALHRHLDVWNVMSSRLDGDRFETEMLSY
jgi:hypothetical protein